MRPDVDLAVIGSGFGGSILAMVARRLGLRVVLIERGRHPRFAIGESASPLAGILLEQLADRYDLPRLRPLSAFGTWRRIYPQVTCGLKRGFTFFRHRPGARFHGEAERASELLVAASPHDELSDTHWLRAEVDWFLAREAEALGAEHIQEAALDGFRREAGAVVLTGERGGRPLRLSAGFVVDASGPRGFVSRALRVPEAQFQGYPGTQALFSHFTGVARCAAMPEYDTGERPPYPIDDAALHHVFDGGWMWVLRFGNGVTSAGVAVTDAVAADLRLADGEPAWRRLLARYPSVAAQFADARPIRAFTWMPRLAWRAAAAEGDGWAMLPSAAAFVDPLFSTGIPLTLLGIERLARRLGGEGGPARGTGAYGAETLADADHTARFVAGCYAAFPRFPVFAAYSMFYFAAASFSEMARRLEAPVRPARFLCADHAVFGPATLRLAPAGGNGDPAAYAREVSAAIDVLNVAGLADPAKRNWYGVDLEDTVRASWKLGLAPRRVRAALERAMAAAGVAAPLDTASSPSSPG